MFEPFYVTIHSSHLLGTDSTDFTDFRFATLWNSGMGWLTFKSVTIPEGASLVIKNETAESKLAFDCIKVTKIAAE